jgi:hypothetical protein
MGSTDDGSYERYTGKVYFKDPPQETGSGGQTATDSGKGSSHYSRKEGKVIRKLPPEDSLGKLGIGRQQRTQTDPEVTVVSIDEYRKTELVERVTTLEAAFVTARNDKFAYYKDTKTDTKTGQIPAEHRGYPAFHVKYTEGLPDYGP